MSEPRRRKGGRAVYSTTTIASPPPNGSGNCIVLGDAAGVKQSWSNLLDLCVDLENSLDLRISRLMLIREEVQAVRAETERIIFAVEEGVLP